jgi:hypothetical protein
MDCDGPPRTEQVKTRQILKVRLDVNPVSNIARYIIHDKEDGEKLGKPALQIGTGNAKRNSFSSFR